MLKGLAPLEEIDARLIQPYYTKRLAEAAGMPLSLAFDGAEGELAEHELPAEASEAPVAPAEQPPAATDAHQEFPLIDLLPVGVLLYRLDRLIHANPAFLTQMGFASFAARSA